ncbi:MAG: XylR family transcriptional regulator, partial [Planctomycetota bacterium]
MPHLPRVAILLDTSTSHGRGVLRGIAGFTRAHQLWETFVFKGRLEEYPQGMRNWTGSGVLVKNGNRQILREVEKLDVPFVIIDDIEEQENTPCHVGPDLVRAGRMAAEHFIDHGLRRLAFFGGSFDHPALLIEGYQGKLSEQGLAAELHWREELVNDWETHRKQTAEWLKQLETPAGIFCVDDNQARVVLHCCNDLDIHVPEEIAILGLQNDRTMCELVYPTLSSIDLDSERIGYEAARLLDLRMAGENPPDQPLLIKPRGVMTRLSSEINAVEDP